VLCCVVLCCVVLCCVVLCCVVLRCVVLYCSVLFCVMLCVLCCVALRCDVLCCVVLRCVVLCCVVLRCVVLCCVVLCCHTCCKGKVTVHPRTNHECPEGEYRYSSTISLTSALDESRWSTSRPGRFTPWKDPVPIVQEAGWAQRPVWTGEEKLLRLEFHPRTVQPVTSRHTNCAIPAPSLMLYST